MENGAAACMETSVHGCVNTSSVPKVSQLLLLNSSACSVKSNCLTEASVIGKLKSVDGVTGNSKDCAVVSGLDCIVEDGAAGVVEDDAIGVVEDDAVGVVEEGAVDIDDFRPSEPELLPFFCFDALPTIEMRYSQCLSRFRHLVQPVFSPLQRTCIDRQSCGLCRGHANTKELSTYFGFMTCTASRSHACWL